MYSPLFTVQMCIFWVVYDLFREFSQPTLKHRSLFCCLSAREQIPERLAALLALKHPDVPLLAPYLLMKALQQVRRPRQRGERRRKIDRQVRDSLIKIDKKVRHGLGFAPFPGVPEPFGPLPDVSLACAVVDPARIGQEGFFPLPLGLARCWRIVATGLHRQLAKHQMVSQLFDLMKDAA